MLRPDEIRSEPNKNIIKQREIVRAKGPTPEGESLNCRSLSSKSKIKFFSSKIRKINISNIVSWYIGHFKLFFLLPFKLHQLISRSIPEGNLKVLWTKDFWLQMKASFFAAFGFLVGLMKNPKKFSNFNCLFLERGPFWHEINNFVCDISHRNFHKNGKFASFSAKSEIKIFANI